MKRELGIVFIFSILLILSLSIISAGFFSDLWTKITGEAISNCIDSDSSSDYSQSSPSDLSIGGDDKYVKGNTSWFPSSVAFDICVKINTNLHVSSCQNSDSTRCGVGEFYCYSGGRGLRYIECEYGCEDGACLTESIESPTQEETCADSDATTQYPDGKNYFVKGSATSLDGYGNPVAETEDSCYLNGPTSGRYVDSCDGEYCGIEEAICEDNDAMVYYPLEGTLCEYGCIDGACCADVDNDGDGYKCPDECDDTNSNIYPGAIELYNSLDDNCDGVIDEEGEVMKINITLFENGEGIVSPENFTLYAGQKVRFQISLGNIEVLSPTYFIPKYDYNESAGFIGRDNQTEIIKLCDNWKCSGDVDVEFIVPDIWIGEYYFELIWSDLTERFYYKFDVQNNFFSIDQGICVPVVENGKHEDKLDVVFIAHNYNETELANFSLKVNDFIYGEYGLLTVEPLKSEADKINFYRVDRVGSLMPLEARGYPEPEFWREMVSQCPDYDLVIVVQPEWVRSFARVDDVPPWILVTVQEETWVLVHEFGHAFANLGDEYINPGIIEEDSYLFDRPNIDREGCPKWCSGEMNQSASFIYGDNSTFDCYDAYLKFFDCVELNEPASCWENVSRIGFDQSIELSNCNFGVSCKNGLGCYWNAKAANTFKSSRYSIMGGCTPGLEESCEFNIISQEAILEKLNEPDSSLTDSDSSLNDSSGRTLFAKIAEWFKNLFSKD